MKGLSLHCGGSLADWDTVRAVKTPEQTGTHFPISHEELVDSTLLALRGGGFEVKEQAHALSKEGANYFGLLEVGNGGDGRDFGMVVGLRNSHCKDFSASLAAGNRVFVCDNLSFSGEVTIARKHTRNILRDLQSLFVQAIGRLTDLHGLQHLRVDRYKEAEIGDVQVHDLLVRSIVNGVICQSKLLKVLGQWNEPDQEEFAQAHNVWRLQNAITAVQKGSNIFNLPKAQSTMFGLLDMAAGFNPADFVRTVAPVEDAVLVQ